MAMASWMEGRQSPRAMREICEGFVRTAREKSAAVRLLLRR
jgi:hypothetical protein